MHSLSQLIAAHAPLLVLDAASTRVQAGWLAEGAPARWAARDDEAGVGLFRALDELEVIPSRAGAFLYCDGPGSILGIRTTAAAIRTWSVLGARPIFAYHSLALLGAALGRERVNVVADARRGAWHSWNRATGLRRVAPETISGESVMPENFRHWAPLPAGVSLVPYAVDDLLRRAADAPLFREAPEPDAFLHEEPSYATWTPQVHRAP
jgi:tRNA threonylcarbamoyladenosine biosynthesis protein TsaB